MAITINPNDSVATSLSKLQAAVNALLAGTAMPTTGSLKRLGVVGFNPDYTGNTNFGYSFAFVDRFRTASSVNYTNGGAPSVDARGYPLPQTGKQCEVYFNVEASLGPSDKQTYVFESNKANIYFDVHNKTSGATTVTNGITRFQFGIPTTAGGLGTNLTTGALGYFGGFTTPFADNEYISCFRLDEEAEFRSGNMLRQQYIDWHAGFDLRFMDWMNVNNSTTLADVSQRNSFSWSARPPLAIIPEYANRVGGSAYIPINFASTDAQLASTIPYFLGALPTDRPILLETGNEGWNGQFTNQYNAEFVIRNPNNVSDPNQIPQVPHTHGGGENAGYGWMAADLMARALKAGGYDPRLQPVLGSKNVDTNVTLGIFEGVRQRIADWNDTTSRYQNAEFAGRFKDIGDIFVHGAIATYFDGDFGDYPNLTSGAKAVIDDLASRYASGDQSAITSMLQQMQHGNVWQTRGGCFLDNVPNMYGPQIPLFESVGLNPIAYEHEWANGAPDGSARATLFNAVLHDPRATALQQAGINANLAIGISSTFVLADVAEDHSQFGASDFAYDQSAPRFQGILAARTTPIAIIPLAVSVAATGTLQVGRSPTQHLTITNGRGVKKVVCTGLAPGQVVSSNGRIISGQLTTAGVYNISVTVTDEWGGKVTTTINQTVAAAPVLPSGRYLRLAFATDGGGFDMDYAGIIDGNSATHAATWTGDNDRANGLNAEGDGNSYFVFGGNPVNAVGDLGASVTVSQLVVTRTSNAGNVPLGIQAWLTNAPDGSGGTRILNVMEPDKSQWGPSARRVFDVATS